MQSRVIVLSLGLIFLQGSLGHCQESPFRFSLGLNHWFSQWETDHFDGSGLGAYGPKLSVGYKNFGLGLVYLTGNFDLDITGVKNAEADRSDLDIVFQYNFNAYFGASLGFKYFSYDLSSTSIKVTETLTGVGLGVGGYYPLAESGFYLYGTTSYLPALSIDYENKIDDESDSGDGWASNTELGFGYAFAQLPLSIDLGYRYQKISKEGLGRNTSDTFQGPVIDVSYSF